MAFSSILRNKSSTFLRAFASTAQLIRKTQSGHRAVLSSAVNRYEDSFVPRLHFSSVAVKNKSSSDDNLLRVIESEITCAQETDDYCAVSFISRFLFHLFIPTMIICLLLLLIIKLNCSVDPYFHHFVELLPILKCDNFGHLLNIWSKICRYDTF
jgi:hypothetical protein